MDEKVNLSPEELAQLQAFLQKNDFSANMSVKRSYTLSKEDGDIFGKTRKIFGKYWLENLQSLGIGRKMKNFSPDYPVNFLENADADWLSSQITEIYSDPETLENSIAQMYEIYEEPIEKGLEGYAGLLGKSVDDLTDDEILYVVTQTAEVAGQVVTNVLMQGQQVPELFQLTKKLQAHQDYKEDFNLDHINFYNKWMHYKTKLGAPLFFCELSEEEANGIEGAKDFFASADSKTQKEYEELRDAFADTLSSTDREIFYLREQKCTQEEIAARLGYKTHSAVTKRLTAMRKQFDEFTAAIEASAKE